MQILRRLTCQTCSLNAGAHVPAFVAMLPSDALFYDGDLSPKMIPISFTLLLPISLDVLYKSAPEASESISKPRRDWLRFGSFGA